MFDVDAPALLRDGALLVNVARGELVDTRAVVREVRAGRLRVALDVSDPEPLPPGHPLWNLRGALIAPHVAALTDAFAPMTADFLRRQLYRQPSRGLAGPDRHLELGRAAHDRRSPHGRSGAGGTVGPRRLRAVRTVAPSVVRLVRLVRRNRTVAGPAARPREGRRSRPLRGGLQGAPGRCRLAATVHAALSARQGLPPSVEERLAAHVGQARSAVHHVVAAVYEHALAPGGSADLHALVNLIKACSPILQQVRYATELLLPHDKTSPRKAEHGDNGRISG